DEVPWEIRPSEGRPVTETASSAIAQPQYGSDQPEPLRFQSSEQGSRPPPTFPIPVSARESVAICHLSSSDDRVRTKTSGAIFCSTLWVVCPCNVSRKASACVSSSFSASSASSLSSSTDPSAWPMG